MSLVSRTLIERGFVPALGWSKPVDMYTSSRPVIELGIPLRYNLDEETGVFGVTDERGILWVLNVGDKSTRVITDDFRGLQSNVAMYLPRPEQIAQVLGAPLRAHIAA